MRVHPCLYEHVHRDGILKEGQYSLHGYLITSPLILNRPFSKLLPSIWDKRRAYKKVIDF